MTETEEEFKTNIGNLISDCSDRNLTDEEIQHSANSFFEDLKSQGFCISRWRTIEEAPKDGTPVLIKLKDQLPDSFLEKDRFEGMLFVARHTGLAEDGFDIGWQFAAPVGMGGFTDDFIAGFTDLPTPPKGGE